MGETVRCVRERLGEEDAGGGASEVMRMTERRQKVVEDKRRRRTRRNLIEERTEAGATAGEKKKMTQETEGEEGAATYDNVLQRTAMYFKHVWIAADCCAEAASSAR